MPNTELAPEYQDTRTDKVLVPRQDLERVRILVEIYSQERLRQARAILRALLEVEG